MSLLDLYAARGPLIMGVINVTPDSFSDGGRHQGLEAALAHAEALLEAGADVLDIGGESTRPGAHPVGVTEEINRIAPVIDALSRRTDAPLSVDTFKPEVAEEACHAGATIWNDISALGAPDALETAARLNMEVVLMHMQGEPRTMQAHPWYEDVVAEVVASRLHPFPTTSLRPTGASECVRADAHADSPVRLSGRIVDSPRLPRGTRVPVTTANVDGGELVLWTILPLERGDLIDVVASTGSSSHGAACAAVDTSNTSTSHRTRRACHGATLPP